MKHASTEALMGLTSLLTQIRSIDVLVEKSPGVFYRRSKAFLHFHEDSEGLFVDVRLHVDEPFTRLPVTTSRQQSALVSDIRRALSHQ